MVYQDFTSTHAHELIRAAQGPWIRGTQVKSIGNQNWMSPLRRSDGAYFSETPPSWHVTSHVSLIVIMNY